MCGRYYKVWLYVLKLMPKFGMSPKGRYKVRDYKLWGMKNFNAGFNFFISLGLQVGNKAKNSWWSGCLSCSWWGEIILALHLSDPCRCKKFRVIITFTWSWGFLSGLLWWLLEVFLYNSLLPDGALIWPHLPFWHVCNCFLGLLNIYMLCLNMFNGF